MSAAHPIHTKFCKQLLGVKQATSNKATLAELGRFPLICNILTRTAKFFMQKDTQLSTSLVTSALRTNLKTSNSNFGILKDILLQMDLWDKTRTANTSHKIKTLIHAFKHKIQIEYKNYISEESTNENRQLFWTIKNNYQFANYIREVPRPSWRRAISQIRLSSHRMPIEQGRWHNILRNNRTCKLCNSDEIGDEFHCTFTCTHPDVVQWRAVLTKEIIAISPQFRHLPKKQQFLYLINATDSSINKSGILGHFLMQVFTLHK